MSSYVDLRTEVSDELARDDLTAVLPRFIRQATQRINRDVRVSEMERRARAFGTGTRFLLSPVGFLEMRRMWNVIGTDTTERRQDRRIRQAAPQMLPVRAAGGSLPKWFVLTRGDPPELEFDVELATDNEVEMVYLKRYDEFVADTDTNWLLDTHYDIYFESTLYAAHKYLRNSEEAAERAGAYKAALSELDRTQNRRDYAQPMAAVASQPVF